MEYGNICFSNWWNEKKENSWFYKFAVSCNNNCNLKIHFYSVFGNPNIQLKKDDVNIFFSGENLEPFDYSRENANLYSVKLFQKRILAYGDYQTNRADLSIGFGNKNYANYIRFPLWITYMLEPDDNEETIIEKINAIDKVHNSFDTSGQAALFAGHDDFGTRTEIYETLKQHMTIVCPGKFQHNTGDIWVKDKNQYLRDFKFNICAENVDADGYVSEKIFDAFASGTIPIYIGAKMCPEPEIFNKEAIIQWNLNGNNEHNIHKIMELLHNPKCYHDFCKIPKFQPNAAQKIYAMLTELKNSYNAICTGKRRQFDENP